MKEIKYTNKKMYRKWKRLNFWFNWGGLISFMSTCLLASIEFYPYVNLFGKICCGIALALFPFLFVKGLWGVTSNPPLTYADFLHKEKTKKIYKDNYKWII